MDGRHLRGGDYLLFPSLQAMCLAQCPPKSPWLWGLRVPEVPERWTNAGRLPKIRERPEQLNPCSQHLSNRRPQSRHSGLKTRVQSLQSLQSLQPLTLLRSHGRRTSARAAAPSHDSGPIRYGCSFHTLQSRLCSPCPFPSLLLLHPHRRFFFSLSLLFSLKGDESARSFSWDLRPSTLARLCVCRDRDSDTETLLQYQLSCSHSFLVFVEYSLSIAH